MPFGGMLFGVINLLIEGLSLLQSIPPTTANKQTQAQKKRGSMARKLLGANAKSYRLKLKLKLRRLDSKAPTRLAPAGTPPPQLNLLVNSSLDNS